jgi:hypothetical protein
LLLLPGRMTGKAGGFRAAGEAATQNAGAPHALAQQLALPFILITAA